MVSTLETLRAFQRDCWLAIAGLGVGWLLVQDLTGDGQFNANSNIVLLAVVGWFGWHLHDRFFLIRLGPHPALTPGLGRSTMLVCLVLIGAVALVGAVFCWRSGNRVPALGPSVLLVTVTLTGAHRIRAARAVKWLMQFGAFGVILLAVAEDEHLRTVARYAERLSDPWLQVGSLVVAALACTLRKPMRHRAFLPVLIVPRWPHRAPDSARDEFRRLRTTARAMDVSRLDRGLSAVVWVVVGASLAPSFTDFGSHPANANVVVLWLLAAIGGIVGRRVDEARSFHGFLLVDGFARSVTLTSYGLVAIASVVGAAISLTVGNWIPPIAPGVFVALVMVRHHRLTGPVTAFGLLFIGSFRAVWGVSGLERFSEFTSVLSHPWIQFAALVATVSIVRQLGMARKRPVLLGGRSTVTSGGYSLRRTIIENVASSTRSLVFMFLFPLFLWVFNSDFTGFALRLCALGWVMVMVRTAATADVEGRMVRDWLLGATDSRLALARRCIAFDVAGVISWVPAGMVGVLLLGTLPDVQGDALPVVLLVGLIAAFAMIALRGWTLGRLPDGWRSGIDMVALLHLLGVVGVVFLLDVARFRALDYALLVSATVTAGVLAVEVGGRGLAKAKILNSPSG